MDGWRGRTVMERAGGMGTCSSRCKMATKNEYATTRATVMPTCIHCFLSIFLLISSASIVTAPFLLYISCFVVARPPPLPVLHFRISLRLAVNEIEADRWQVIEAGQTYRARFLLTETTQMSDARFRSCSYNPMEVGISFYDSCLTK